MIDKKSAKLLDECTDGKWRNFVDSSKIEDDGIHQETEEGYIYGVHCGDANCYACGTQRYNCSWLDAKDNLEDEKKS